YFRRAEASSLGGDEYRGDAGPLNTCRGPMTNPLYQAFIDAGVQAGYGHTPDMNGWRQEGFGRMDMTVRNGRRWSTANAYLRPAMGRPNLKVEGDALVERITIDGQRATGIRYSRGGQPRTARARR